MAVQQNKKSPSRRGMRRSHDAIAKPAIATERSNGELHFRHHMSPSGFYRGKKIIQSITETSS